MNERTLELYRQAQVPHTAIDPSNNMPYETTCFSAEKFAQLIIQDCISQIALIGISNFENDDISWTVDFAIKNIQEKFGVTNENTNRSSQD